MSKITFSSPIRSREHEISHKIHGRSGWRKSKKIVNFHDPWVDKIVKNTQSAESYGRYLDRRLVRSKFRKCMNFHHHRSVWPKSKKIKNFHDSQVGKIAKNRKSAEPCGRYLDRKRMRPSSGNAKMLKLRSQEHEIS